MFSIHLRFELRCIEKNQRSFDQIFSRRFRSPVASRKGYCQSKASRSQNMYNLIPEDCHAFYNNLTGKEINEDVDGYGPTLDFDLEEK